MVMDGEGIPADAFFSKFDSNPNALEFVLGLRDQLIAMGAHLDYTWADGGDMRASIPGLTPAHRFLTIQWAPMLSVFRMESSLTTEECVALGAEHPAEHRIGLLRTKPRCKYPEDEATMRRLVFASLIKVWGEPR